MSTSSPSFTRRYNAPPKRHAAPYIGTTPAACRKARLRTSWRPSDWPELDAPTRYELANHLIVSISFSENGSAIGGVAAFGQPTITLYMGAP